MGSKNRWMYITKAIRAPTSSALAPTSRAPKKITSAIEIAGRISTTGSTPAERRVACRFELRFSLFNLSNCSRFCSCLLTLWTTLTPAIFSFSAPLTVDAARLTLRNAPRARGCHTAMNMIRIGSVTIEIRPSIRLRIITTAVIPTRLRRSPTVTTATPRNS